MFKRVIFEDWAQWVPIVSFFIFLCVFIAVSIRALLMHKSDRERLASLPLESPTSPPNEQP